MGRSETTSDRVDLVPHRQRRASDNPRCPRSGVPDLLLTNSTFYVSLTDEQRQWIDLVAARTTEKQRQLWHENEQKAVDALKEQGMLFNDVDIALFASRIEPVYKEAYEKYGEEFEQICKDIKEVE